MVSPMGEDKEPFEARLGKVEGEDALPGQSRGYSAMTSPEPPISAGKSLNFGKPSRMGSTVSA